MGHEDRGLRVRRRRVCPAQGRAPAPLPARLRGGGGGAGGCTWWRGAGGWPAAGTSRSRCWGCCCCCCWRAQAPGRWSACPVTSPSARSLGAAREASCRAFAAAATCAPARGTRAAVEPMGSMEPATGGCAVSSAPRSMAIPSQSTKWASAKVRLPRCAPPSHLAGAEQSLLETFPRGERVLGEEGPSLSPGGCPRCLPRAGRGRVAWVILNPHRHTQVRWLGLTLGGPFSPEARCSVRGGGDTTESGMREPLGESAPAALPA